MVEVRYRPDGRGSKEFLLKGILAMLVAKMEYLVHQFSLRRPTPVQAETPLTVAGLLNSLGLGKYAIHFQAEEVDMMALRQMGEKDLKDLGIPMGPRIKILQALSALSKRPLPRKL